MGLKKSASLGNWFNIPQDLNEYSVCILSVMKLGRLNLGVVSGYGFGCRIHDLLPFLTIVEFTCE